MKCFLIFNKMLCPRPSLCIFLQFVFLYCYLPAEKLSCCDLCTSMTSVQSRIKLKVKEKRNQYYVLYHCDSLALRKSVCVQIQQQIQIYYQYISIVNRFFLWEWTYQKLMKLFSLSPYLLVCYPQGIVLVHQARLWNNTASYTMERGHFELQRCCDTSQYNAMQYINNTTSGL